MARNRIEIETGGILPVYRATWCAAEEKIAEASNAIQSMESARDRVAFEAGWSCFVDSLQEFWERFCDEGKTVSTAFPPWAGAIESKRKSDALLQYLFQARHQSQHGRISLNWEEQRLLVAPGFNGHLKGLKLFADGTYELDSTPSHPSVPEATVVNSPGKPLLPDIQNRRFGQRFPPPAEHLGKSISEKTPLAVARAGLAFYGDVFKQARQKFGC